MAPIDSVQNRHPERLHANRRNHFGMAGSRRHHNLRCHTGDSFAHDHPHFFGLRAREGGPARNRIGPDPALSRSFAGIFVDERYKRDRMLKNASHEVEDAAPSEILPLTKSAGSYSDG